MSDNDIVKLSHQIDMLERKVDFILKQLKLEYDDSRYDDAMLDSIRRLIADGNKIEAIKVYREQKGVGLVEAKDAVEEIERNMKGR